MKQEIEFLINRLQTHCLNSDGLMSSSFPPSPDHLLCDFNDYLPYFKYFGCNDFVQQQLNAARKKVICGLIPIGNRIISWRQDEWLEALFDQCKDGGQPEVKGTLDDGIQFIRENLCDAGMIRCFYNLDSGKTPRIFDPRSGALLEALLDIGESFPAAFDLALACLERVIEWSTQNGQWLIPDNIFYSGKLHQKISEINPLNRPRRYLYPYAEGWRSHYADRLMSIPFASQITLAKQNSNLIHAFIRAYFLTKDSRYLGFIHNWFTAFQKHMFEDGRCFSYLSNRLRRRDVKLSHNHPILEICIDMHLATGQKIFLDTACQMARYWTSVRLPNGLFPAFSDSRYSFVDDQTDLLVLFVKLSRMLGNEEYLQLAHDLYNDIIRIHMTEDGLSTYSYLNGNGTPLVVHPKFNGLFLKAPIALENYTDILKDDYLLLLRDR